MLNFCYPSSQLVQIKLDKVLRDNKTINLINKLNRLDQKWPTHTQEIIQVNDTIKLIVWFIVWLTIKWFKYGFNLIINPEGTKMPEPDPMSDKLKANGCIKSQ